MLPAAGTCSLNLSGTSASRRAKSASIAWACAASIRCARRAPEVTSWTSTRETLACVVAQEDQEMIAVNGEGIVALGKHRRPALPGLLHLQVIAVAPHGEHAVRRNPVPADILIDRHPLSGRRRHLGNANGADVAAVHVQHQLGRTTLRIDREIDLAK